MGEREEKPKKEKRMGERKEKPEKEEEEEGEACPGREREREAPC
jgi:hypothetical protein